MKIYSNDREVVLSSVEVMEEDNLNKLVDNVGRYARSLVVKKVFVKEIDGNDFYDLVEVVLKKVYGNTKDVDGSTKFNLGEFLSFVNEVGYRDEKNPIGFDDWLLKLAIDDSKLFEFLREWDFTKDFVNNFDYNFKREDKLGEISTKIYYSGYNGRTELLENYFMKYLELNGGFSDEDKAKIVGVMCVEEEMTGSFDYESEVVGGVRTNSGKEDYDKLLSTFKLCV